MMNVIIQVLKSKFSELCKNVIIYFVKTCSPVFESKIGKAKPAWFFSKVTKFHPHFKTNERNNFSGKVNSKEKNLSERPEGTGHKISYNRSIKPKSQKNLAFTCLSQFKTSQNLQWQSTGRTWQVHIWNPVRFQG